MKTIKARRVEDRVYSESVATTEKSSFGGKFRKGQKVYSRTLGIGEVRNILSPEEVSVNFLLKGIRVVKTSELRDSEISIKELPSDILSSISLIKSDISSIIEETTSYAIVLRDSSLSEPIIRKFLQNKEFEGIVVRNGKLVILFTK
jgi:hypothetical protein